MSDPEEIPSDAEIEAMFAKMHKMRDDIKNKLDTLSALANLNPQQSIQKLLDPNFTDPKLLKAVEAKFEGLFQISGIKLDFQKALASHLAKNRQKSKSIGFRKNWLPMK